MKFFHASVEWSKERANPDYNIMPLCNLYDFNQQRISIYETSFFPEKVKGKLLLEYNLCYISKGM